MRSADNGVGLKVSDATFSTRSADNGIGLKVSDATFTMYVSNALIIFTVQNVLLKVCQTSGCYFINKFE